MATTRLWTVEELEREGAPEGRWELIDGELIEMTPASSHSGNIGATVLIHIGNHVIPRGLGKVYNADSGFAPFPGRDLVRAPDVAFVRAERLPSQPDEVVFYRLAPDLVVEVVSPSDRKPDVFAKVMMWLDAGVRLVWVVDPRARTVTVHGQDRMPRVLREGDVLDGGEVLPDFRLPVSAIFA